VTQVIAVKILAVLSMQSERSFLSDEEREKSLTPDQERSKERFKSSHFVVIVARHGGKAEEMETYETQCACK
jgi:hypothetical protein